MLILRSEGLLCRIDPTHGGEIAWCQVKPRYPQEFAFGWRNQFQLQSEVRQLLLKLFGRGGAKLQHNVEPAQCGLVDILLVEKIRGSNKNSRERFNTDE